jgi:hypothetical protein
VDERKICGKKKKKKKKFIYFGERVIFKWNEEKNEEFDVVEVC